MSRFIYSMQNVLNIKFKLEDQAKMHFAEMMSRLSLEEQKLQELKTRKSNYEAEAIELRVSGLNVRQIIDNKNAILRMDEYIKEQLIQVRIAERNVELARKRLEEVMQERKIHEKLREKAFEEFVKEENAKESKEIDELTSYTYGQKKDE